MDQASENIFKMLMQGMFTGNVGPLDQSPDLPTLGFTSMRRSANLPPFVPQESTHIKTPTPEQIIQEILERRDTGTMSSAYDPRPSSPIMETALSHVPMDWRGKRQSTNVEDIRGHKAQGQIDELFNTLTALTRKGVLPRGTERRLFPQQASPAPIGLGYKPTLPSPQAPTDAILEQLIMSDPRFWDITSIEADPEYAEEWPDYPDLRDFLPD